MRLRAHCIVRLVGADEQLRKKPLERGLKGVREGGGERAGARQGRTHDAVVVMRVAQPLEHERHRLLSVRSQLGAAIGRLHERN